MNRYSWFQNKNSFDGFSAEGIKLDTSSLKLLLLDKHQQFSLTVKNKKHTIKYLAKCRVVDSKNYVNFGISIDKGKVYIIRINGKNEYDPTLLYCKADFLRLCSIVSRKLKFE